MDKNISRRNFLKIFGAGSVATAATMAGCKGSDKAGEQAAEAYKNQVEPPVGKMTYRENPKTKEKVSILGYGMMRLPTKPDNDNEFDQDMINKQVDYAIEHGLNYFDTSPVYCQGQSERCTGIALKQVRINPHLLIKRSLKCRKTLQLQSCRRKTRTRRLVTLCWYHTKQMLVIGGSQ